MKKIIIDRKLYTIKNKEFEELEKIVLEFQIAPSDKEIASLFKYRHFCENLMLKYGEGKHVDGVYFTNG